ncbi:MAG: energy-coupling factor transporter ATPase [Eubacteriales bacterium]|nr:energy-coupling factor transporter ATPase [Eubacteriales bacterium]
MAVIKGRDISFSYGSGKKTLDHASIRAEAGELIALLGCNGCGKSTLVRHLNALLPLQKGELRVAGLDARAQANCWRLRRQCGMVFQNPDNQFVSSVVEEDIAFGLENYETPEEEIPTRVRAALAAVGMSGFEKRAPHLLSGGQKQRVALAGVLALNPDIIVFDEVTAMLDPQGRREVLGIIDRLRAGGKKTLVMITHYVEEAVMADRVYLMAGGNVTAQGSPRDILTDAALLAQNGLLAPLPVRMYEDLKAAGVPLERCPLTNEELVEELCRFA